MSRKFTDAPAVRSQTPIFVGLVGPSGSGKTFSALRLATGMQRVAGGDIYVVDTEAGRALHYADQFSFRHVPFEAPFDPLDYLAAIEYCVKQGAKTIIVDSMSHEHEGPGGVLEQHDAELDRLAGDDWKKRQRVNMLAWAKPKAARRRLINSIVQLGVNGIFCFRAKEKLKMQPGREPIELGWQAIAGEEFIYEMTMNMLLLPNSGGVPTFNPEKPGEKQLVKPARQFADLFAKPKPLDEDTGEAMARWASGDEKPAKPEAKAKSEPASDPKPEIPDELGGSDPTIEEAVLTLSSAPDKRKLAAASAGLKTVEWTAEEKAQINAAWSKRKAELEEREG